jgi:hypothetical protein
MKTVLKRWHMPSYYVHMWLCLYFAIYIYVIANLRVRLIFFQFCT